MDPFVFITVVTLVAGAGGTGLGGIVGALFRSESNRTVSLLLSFAGGIMLSIVCFDLLTESVEAAETFTSQAVLVAAGAVIAGVAVVYGLNLVIDRRTRHEVPHVARKSHRRRMTTSTSSSMPTTWQSTASAMTRRWPCSWPASSWPALLRCTTCPRA